MKDQIAQFQEMIESSLSKLDLGTTPSELYDPVYYFLSLGGKRFRPLLTLLGHSLFDEDVSKSVAPALAVEIFHNFTLVHDDIMDEAPLRRGNETVHEKWNTNIAILSGDVMMIKAYDQLLHANIERLRMIISKFNTCGTEVCEGQQFDMNFETRDTVSVEEYINMIKLKTAVLLGFALELGALNAGASVENAELLRKFGTSVGIGFQLKDDFLDVYGDAAKFGKRVGGDIISNKKTYLLIQALKNANPEQKNELQRWIDAVDFDEKEKVEKVTQLYNEIGVDKDTKDLMNHYFQAGFEYLALVQCDENKKKILADFSSYLINRDN